MPKPRVSVVVVHYQTPRALRRCLRSLQSLPEAEQMDIWVVDNATPHWDLDPFSRDFPSVNWIRRPVNEGYSAAANAGLRASSGELVFLLNADTLIFPGAVTDQADFLDRHRDVAVTGPQILNMDGSREWSARGFPHWWTPFVARYSPITLLWPRNPWSARYLLDRGDHAAEREADWVSGAAMMLRRRAVEEAGGFDESFFLYMEDVDLCRRLKTAGWKIFYVPRALIMHAIGSSSAQQQSRAILAHHRSIWRYYRKHFPPSLLRDPLIATGTLLRAIMELVRAGLKPWIYSRGGEAYREPYLKRPLDVVLSLTGLVLTAPLWISVPVAIWLEDRHGPLYRQPRVGRYGRPFFIYKFRTMRPGVDERNQAGKLDPRVTRIGRHLRNAAIDEIPQLLNILRGDMSLVGPRALLETEIGSNDQELQDLPRVSGWDRRVLMRPGLTGLAQVYARRDLPVHQKVRIDLLYLRPHSLWLDVKLIARSVWISLTARWDRIQRKQR